VLKNQLVKCNLLYASFVIMAVLLTWLKLVLFLLNILVGSWRLDCCSFFIRYPWFIVLYDCDALQQIYTSVELMSVCPAECEQFAQANNDFRRLMKATEQNNNVLQCCERKGEFCQSNNYQKYGRSLAGHPHLTKCLLRPSCRRLRSPDYALSKLFALDEVKSIYSQNLV
jgi:hypothetical protein